MRLCPACDETVNTLTSHEVHDVGHGTTRDLHFHPDCCPGGCDSPAEPHVPEMMYP